MIIKFQFINSTAKNSHNVTRGRVMNCPYCNKEMEKGVIQSPQEISWQKKRFLIGAAEFHEGSVVLAEFSFLRGSCVTAYLCRQCGKVVIDVIPQSF